MEIKKVVIEVIPYEEQRYPTIGDWFFDKKGALQIRITDIGSWMDELLCGHHEFVEAFLCSVRGITEKMVDDWDNKFEEERKQGLHGDDDEPGEDPKAPYYNEHLFATGEDMLLCQQLGLNWKEYYDKWSPIFEKDMVLEHLEDTYLTLKPSPIHGVGVFAIRDIPKGTSPFSIGMEGYVDLEPTDFESLPSEVKDHVKNYCTKNEGKYNVPIAGFKVVDLVQFLNDSKTPNIKSLDDGVKFEAIRDIKAGEELTIDYDTITED